MRLSQLLKIHKLYASQDGHPKVFGDAYLISENFVYRNLHNAVLKSGGRFVEAWPEYISGALYQLDEIVKRKRIPLVFNTELFASIEAKRKNTFGTKDLPELPRCYALHESAHLVAHSILKGIGANTTNSRLLKIVMGESFANTVEVIGSALATSECHYAFFQCNTYRLDNSNIRLLILKLIDEIGFQPTFKIIFYSYLYSNFLYSEVSMRLVREIFAGLHLGFRPSARLLKDCYNLFTDGIHLSEQFRVHTTGYFLRSLGFTGDVHDLLGFNFRALIKSNKRWSRAIEEMGLITEFGPRGSELLSATQKG